jgi:Fe2+ or Zn2+ uptake regulation protein
MVSRSVPVVPLELSSVEDVLAAVRAGGGRITTAKRLVVEVLFAEEGHRAAEEITDAVQVRAPEVAMTTVYRNLDELQRLGVVTHTHLGHGPAVFQLAGRAHAHFVCEGCGAQFTAPDLMFAGLARRAREILGFRVDPRHFAIVGRCAACS